MNFNNERAFAFCHALIAIQLLSLFISAFSDNTVLFLGPVTYCLTVFTTPLLVLGYGYRYLNFTNSWLLEGIPLIVELFLAILFVGSMIYGIRLEDAHSLLFTWLLVAYLADVLLCTLGYLLYRTMNKRIERRKLLDIFCSVNR